MEIEYRIQVEHRLTDLMTVTGDVDSCKGNRSGYRIRKKLSSTQEETSKLTGHAIACRIQCSYSGEKDSPRYP